ncbi:MAG: DUF47 family protein [Myxococcaceae bacterium]|nr:DUF47 family protein [Myxococcaceae bacterium]
MALQGLVRWLLPKEDHFFGYLESLATLGAKAATTLSNFGKPGHTLAEVRDAVQKVEHEADAVVRQLEDALARTFVTPIDREDLHRLGGLLDDVVDMTNLAARQAAMFGVESPTEPMVKLMEVLVRSTVVLAEVVPLLRSHRYAEVLEKNRLLRAMEKEADLVFRAAITQLFHDPAIDAKALMRQKAVLDDLERAIDRCDEVADTLSNLAVKHG